MGNKTISVAYGDGIGPEIMEETLHILKEAGARITIEAIDIGESQYLKGWDSGISPTAFESVKKNKVLLKAPITTPQGKGYKSLNVTFRKALGLFANIRPAVSYAPFVKGLHEKMDIVIFRENEEDLYSGVEYRSTTNASTGVKLLTRQGSEKIIRAAFEFAKNNGRKKVTCMIKDNIMKILDGTFAVIFDHVAKEYPELEADKMIVDIGSARVASHPYDFDVIVTLNLYGDIISDIAAEVSGSVGLAGSANIGDEYAMFEAIHGSAPDIAGKGVANPSGLLHGAIMMLNHIGQGDIAAKIHNAWLKTIEEGYHTADIYNKETSKQQCSSKEFTKHVVANLGKKPEHFAAVDYSEAKPMALPQIDLHSQDERLIGLDIYVEEIVDSISELVAKYEHVHDKFELQHIAQRGIKYWPNIEVAGNLGDMWRLRYILADDDHELSQEELLALQSKVIEKGGKIAMTHVLNLYEGMAGFTKAQGE
jgi:isocitrate dehydrogenase